MSEMIPTREAQESMNSKSANEFVVESFLRDLAMPIGVSKCTIIESLPEQLRSSLPSTEKIESEFGDWEVE